MINYMKNFVKGQIRQYPLMLKSTRYILAEVRGGNVRRFVHWLVAGHAIKYWRVKNWLRVSQPKYLQVGGGRHLKKGGNWINGDIINGEIYLNATKRLPFPNESVDTIFTEQFIEHLSQPEALYFLNEAYRVLKTGGIIRQSTPDLGKLMTLYEDRNDQVSLSTAIARHMRNHRNNVVYADATGCQLLNDIFRLWGHQFIYDKEALQSVTEQVGFREFHWVSFGKSDHDFLKNLERHADEEWMKNGIVMAGEARK